MVVPARPNSRSGYRTSGATAMRAMPKIAISYRRADSRATVGRIFDHLAERYGEKEIFIDIDNIPYGADFREHIDSILRQIEILIVVVGAHWRGPKESGPPRIFDEADPVRIELQTALKRSIRIVPVLVDDAVMPQAGDLPESLQEFSFRNALRVDSGVDFKFHMARLIGVLDQILGKTAGTTPQEKAAEKLAPAAGVTAEPVLPIPIIIKYVVVPTVLLSLAHYLILVKFNLDLRYLRLACIVIPMLCGFLLFWLDHRTLGPAVLMGTTTAVITVVVMQTIVAMIDRTTILPSTPLEWQEALEFLASISLASTAGNLIARMLKSTGLRNRWRTGS
jgi:hypothetical protein